MINRPRTDSFQQPTTKKPHPLLIEEEPLALDKPFESNHHKGSTFPTEPFTQSPLSRNKENNSSWADKNPFYKSNAQSYISDPFAYSKSPSSENATIQELPFEEENEFEACNSTKNDENLSFESGPQLVGKLDTNRTFRSRSPEHYF